MKKKIIYLDNAATSWPKPPEVVEAVRDCLRYYCANPGRGGHYMAMRSMRAVYNAREKLNTFFNAADPQRIIFTKNCTEAINVALHGILKKGDHVITTKIEHNAVARPLNELSKKGIITISYAGNDTDGYCTPEMIEREITPRTRMIITTFSSNVTGMVLPVEQIGAVARKNKVLYMLDSAQGAGIFPIDVQKMNIDILAFAGHKSLLGPQGTGGLIVAEGIAVQPLIQGGTGSDSVNPLQPMTLPEALESGTINTPGIVGLTKGIQYINGVGIKEIAAKKKKYIKFLKNELNHMPGVILYGHDTAHENTGIVAFNIDGIDSQDLAYSLDREYSIATRGGLHCAPSMHKILGTLETGCVRASVGVFTNFNEIVAMRDAVYKLAKRR